MSCDPTALAMYKPPGAFGADIATGEGQALGIPASFGGPYVGIFTCRQEYIRQLPGRIAGKTVDTEGRTGYVLTLQPREQHIRREHATSNICTSTALIGLWATIYLALMGKQLDSATSPSSATRRRTMPPPASRSSPATAFPTTTPSSRSSSSPARSLPRRSAPPWSSAASSAGWT